jgi:formylglycine-generating enzyme required for sulfatase activity
LIFVPAGKYGIGSTSGRADEFPVHEIALDAFEIDRFPMTFDEVRDILEKAGLPLPFSWRQNYTSYNDAPATDITFFEAKTIAELCGKRLPSEEEWEIAATHLPGIAVAAWWGTWNWTRSTYGWYPMQNDKRRQLPKNWVVVKGGVWTSFDKRPSARSFRDPKLAYSRVGFRCVRDIKV